MIVKIFSVYDSKSEAFGLPMFLKSSAEAIRSFTDAASSPDCMLSKFPGDFTLFELGAYNHTTGMIDVLSTPKSLGLLLELLPKS